MAYIRHSFIFSNTVIFEGERRLGRDVSDSRPTNNSNNQFAIYSRFVSQQLFDRINGNNLSISDSVIRTPNESNN